jgi:hypothetical protein
MTTVHAQPKEWPSIFFTIIVSNSQKFREQTSAKHLFVLFTTDHASPSFIVTSRNICPIRRRCRETTIVSAGSGSH